jgi:hypothetical protein
LTAGIRRRVLRWANFRWALLAGAVIAAVIRVGTVPSSRRPFRADENMRRAMFSAVALAEPAMRARAAESFPGDLWSADDDFHNAELRLASSLAASYGVQLSDVLRAIDEGIREHWPVSGPPPSPFVAPCHPRPIF